MIFLPLFLATVAITPTVIPTPSLVPTNASEIQKFREVIQEKVKAKLQEISQSADIDPKRGYHGTITSLDNGQISLNTKLKNQIINFNDETVFLNTKSTKVKSTDLKVGQEVLAIGLLDDKGVLTAKRIIMTSPQASTNNKSVIYGQVVDVSTMYSLIAVIPVSNKNIQYQIKSDIKNMQIVSKTGEKLTLKDIVKGKKIVIISTTPPSPSKNLSVEKIIVLN